MSNSIMSALYTMALVPNLTLTGTNFSSPTLASAISNLEPAQTFLVAVKFRFFEITLLSSSYNFLFRLCDKKFKIYQNGEVRHEKLCKSGEDCRHDCFSIGSLNNDSL